MRAVVDTNILISALISPGGLPDLLYQLWQAKKFNLVISEFQIEELREVTRYPHLTERFKPYNAGRLINSLRDNALVIGELPEVHYSPDPKDNPILSTGIEGQVQYIVSGDKRDMLKLEKVKGIPILSVREFVGLFIELEN